MTDKANYYIFLGISSNSVIECVFFEGYNSDDVHYYLLDKLAEFQKSYPFIHQVISNLMEIYRKQYKVELNLSNFRELLKTSEEFSTNFIKVIESSSKTVINACSYYQNSKKTI